MRNKFGEVLSNIMIGNEEVYFITADTGNSIVMSHQDNYKKKFIDVGI